MMGVQTIRAILEAITNGDHGLTSLVWWGKSGGVRVRSGGHWGKRVVSRRKHRQLVKMTHIMKNTVDVLF